MKHAWWFLALAAIAGCGPTESFDYVPCASPSECTGGSMCHPVVWLHGSGSVCTVACGIDSDCPHHGNCIDVDNSGAFFCYERCTSDAACPTPFVCGVLSTGEGICLPRTP